MGQLSIYGDMGNFLIGGDNRNWGGINMSAQFSRTVQVAPDH
jgi:hypothetical protein